MGNPKKRSGAASGGAANTRVANKRAANSGAANTRAANTRAAVNGGNGKGKSEGKSDLLVRIQSGAAYVLVSAACILASNVTTLLLVAATAAICASEFYNILRSDAKLPNEIIGIVGAVLYPVSVFFFGKEGAFYVSVLFLLALLTWYVFWMRARISDVAVSFIGAAYTGMLLSGMLAVRMALPEPWGGVLVLGLYLSVWANDSFAYLVGRKFGKHKLAPQVSPKKSWEGFIAGLIGSMLVWYGLSYIPGVSMSIAQSIGFGLLCGLAAVLGDLVESRIKRNSGVKDSGNLLPGHGGLLDRSDSMILVSVVAAVLLSVGGCIPLTV